MDNVRFLGWGGGGEWASWGSTIDTTLSSHIEIQHIASALVSEYECRKSCLLEEVKV